jgi:hypothetical protein
MEVIMTQVLINGKWGGSVLCDIHFAKYAEDKSIAIQLIDHDDGMPFATATVCIPGVAKQLINHPNHALHTGHPIVLIKNWSENEGILESLIAANIVTEPFAQVPTGYVYADACYLLIDQD